MQYSSLAPVLSATESRVCIWIMVTPNSSTTMVRCPARFATGRFAPPGGGFPPPTAPGDRLAPPCRRPFTPASSPPRFPERPRAARHPGQLALAHHADQGPTFQPRHRPAFHDFHGVAHVRFVLLVVDVTNRPPPHKLTVLGVLHQPRNLHPPRAGHAIAGDHPNRCSLGHSFRPAVLLVGRLQGRRDASPVPPFFA